MATARLPDFFVIGAPRAGTTSLFRYLQQHPDVFMSPHKEPAFFACGEAAAELGDSSEPLADDATRARSVLTWDAYTELFEGATRSQRVGEATPTYLYADRAPAAIARHVPGARVVASLRQPVDRAFSHLTVSSRGHAVTGADLRAALAEEAANEPTMLVDDHDLLRPGFYARHLHRWRDALRPEQMHVVRQEHLDASPDEVLAGIFSFLGVDPAFEPDVSVRYNQSGRFGVVSATRMTHGLLPYGRRLAQRLPTGMVQRIARLRAQVLTAERQATTLDPATRVELTERYYADDIRALTEMTGGDYGAWFE